VGVGEGGSGSKTKGMQCKRILLFLCFLFFFLLSNIRLADVKTFSEIHYKKLLIKYLRTLFQRNEVQCIIFVIKSSYTAGIDNSTIISKG